MTYQEIQEKANLVGLSLEALMAEAGIEDTLSVAATVVGKVLGTLPLGSPHAIIFAKDKKIKVFVGDEPIVTLDSPDLQEEMQIKDLLDAGELSSDTLTRLATGIKTEKLEAKDE